MSFAIGAGIRAPQVALYVSLLALPGGLVGCRDNVSQVPASSVKVPEVVASENVSQPPPWDAERFAADALGQLEVLSHWLTGEHELTRAQIERLASSECRIYALRPEPIEEVFADTSFTISRSVATADFDEGQQLGVGIDALHDAVRSVRVTGSEGVPARAHFKIDRIDRDRAEVKTRVIYHASGTRDERPVQQNAIWECSWQLDSDPPRITRITVTQFEEVESFKNAFVDRTAAVFQSEPSFDHQLAFGIDYWRNRIQAQYGVTLYGHHAIAIGDVNQDGLEDLYVCQPAGLPNRLYLRSADETVTDSSAVAGVDWLDRSRSALLLDLDNDGDADLAVELDGIIMFMSNDGQGHFEERASHHYGGALSAADFDVDGDLDLYVASYGKGFQAGGSDKPAGVIVEPTPYHDANNGARNTLLRNEGEWLFSNVTAETGMDHNNRRWSLAASWEDFDNDGDPDLYVANDFGRNNLYRNDGGSFVDVAAELQVEDIAAGMSASWADVDADGWMDLYVGNMYSSAGGRVAGQARFQAAASDDIRALYRRHARGNSLFKNVSGTSFLDVSEEAAVTMGRWAWGSRFVDLNNDGLEDIVVANGFITGADPDDL